MRIATWNVNSIRSRLDQVLDWLKAIQPDLLCLQETKVDDPLFPKQAFETLGYQVIFHGQKSYNGVAFISRLPFEDVRLGFLGELPDSKKAEELGGQKRVLSALINDIRIVNLYVPNGSDLKSEKYIYKLEWLRCLKSYLEVPAERGEALCVLGDFNIALEGRDIHNPKQLTGKIMASEPERKALKSALGDDLEDVFRIFESDTNHWSWWDYRSGAWDRDRGWRIDHIYLSKELLSRANCCYINKEVRGNEKPSDHAPVIVDLNWPPNEEEEEENDEAMNSLNFL